MVGENIKRLRAKKGITQKELAEQLFVTAQAISRWENGEVEPSISTLTKMSKIFGVSVDELLGNEDIIEETQENNEEVVYNPSAAISPQVTVQTKKEPIGYCVHCKKPIYKKEDMVTHSVGVRKHKRTQIWCKECDEEREAARKKAALESLKKRRIWGYILGVIALGIGVWVACSQYSKTDDVNMLIYYIVGGVGLSACIQCLLLNNNFIADVFFGICSWSAVKFPGIIFSMSFEGVKFLIFMKIIFAILGFALGIICFLLALAVSSALSIVVYPFALAKSYRNPLDQ